VECRSKSVSQIAYDCWFNDSNYFAVKFKRLFGITPTEFRLGKKSDKATLTFFVK
jgi:AraC-like DNA-binding protein